MKFNYNDYFSQNDILSISEQDVDYILSCDKGIFKEIKGKNIDEIKRILTDKNFDIIRGLDQSIIYINTNKNLTLVDQSQLLEVSRTAFGNEIEIIYGVGFDDSMKGIKVLIIASKKKV